MSRAGTRRYARLAGTGSYVPERVLDNAYFERLVETNDDWIRKRTGIERRHVVAPGETTLDMCEQAARRALEAAGRAPSDLDLIVVGTTTPDLVFPNMGVLLQERLGAGPCTAFSLEAACAGFVYALNLAETMIVGGRAQRALVVGGEMLSRITDYGDRSTCILFGDGAGAAVLEVGDEAGILAVRTGADGRYQHLLHTTSGLGRAFDRLAHEGHYIRMQGSEVFRKAVSVLSTLAVDLIQDAGLDPKDLDWLVPHQANIRIIQAIAEKLSLPEDKIVVTIAEHGNTSTASVPLALDVGVRDGRIRRGQTVLCVAFGGGFTWGGALFRY
jgi:3-oxoacyl-[acyl-carrier-protein] synthase-3